MINSAKLPPQFSKFTAIMLANWTELIVNRLSSLSSTLDYSGIFVVKELIQSRWGGLWLLRTPAALLGLAFTVLVFSWVNSKRPFENPSWEGRAELGNHWLDGTDNLLFLSIKSCKAPQVSLTELPLWCLWMNQGVNMNTLGWAAMRKGRGRVRERKWQAQRKSL